MAAGEAGVPRIGPMTLDHAGDALSKRMAKLVGTSLFAFGLAMVAFFNKQESADYRADINALELLKRLEECCLDAVNAQKPLRKWLRAAHPELAKRNLDMRERLVERLIEAGLSSAEITRGKVDRPDRFSASEYQFDADELALMVRGDFDYDFPEALTVADYLQRLDLLFRPRKLAVATGFDPEDFPLANRDGSGDDRNEPAEITPEPVRPRQDLRVSPRSSRAMDPFDRSPSLAGFYLKGANLVIAMTNPSAQARQSMALEKKELPVGVETVDIPSIAAVTLEKVAPRRALYQNGDHRERLAKIYGALTINLAAAIASEHSVQSHKRIDMFGLSFSTRRFPFALLAILIVVLAGVLVTLKQAEAASVRLFDDDRGESTLALLMARPWLRFLVWAVLPVIAVWASMPPFPLASWELGTIIAGAVVMAALGLRSFALASKRPSG